MRFRTTLLATAVAAVALLGTGTTAASATPSATHGLLPEGIHMTAYDSIPNRLPLNLVSYGAQSSQIDEIGNEITLTSLHLLGVGGGCPLPISEVTVMLTSSACESVSGSNCVTTPGAAFSEP